jgi:serine/threonine protein phosphatase PrpC
LTQEFACGAYLFAVAHGFGRLQGEAIAPVVLARLRQEFERRARGNGLLRAQARPKGLSGVFAAVLNHVNDHVRSRSASHDDYITAGCSLTAALVMGDRAYLSHVGSTAAYLARDGYVVALTKHDAFESDGIPVLTRALGADSSLDAAFCTFSLSEGDSLVLSGRRLSPAQIQAASAEEQILVVRYAPERANPAATPPPHAAGPLVTGIAATVLFYLLLCLR